METPRKKKTIKTKKKAETAPTGSAIEESKDNIENDVVLKREFELYAIWRAMPPVLRGETAATLEKNYFIDDPLLIDLLQIRTQTQFSEKFNVNKDTLTRWNERLKDRDMFADIRQWSNKLVKNVMLSIYRAAMLKDPKANSDRKLFLQVAGWSEEMKIQNTGQTLADIIKETMGIK